LPNSEVVPIMSAFFSSGHNLRTDTKSRSR
jgi:hypothetical protein